jgi:hypothetical protein
MTQQPNSAVSTAPTALTRSAEPRDGSARRLLSRGLVVVGLVGIALIHLVELPGTWRQTVGLGVLFALLVLAATVVAAGLLHTDNPRSWQASALVAVAAITGYILTRSVALPFDRGDVGNWLEPIGLVALFIEAAVLALCGYPLIATPANTWSSVRTVQYPAIELPGEAGEGLDGLRAVPLGPLGQDVAEHDSPGLAQTGKGCVPAASEV